ncbi:hypothetical protein PMI07_000853 [Rhizobium sp. CF080]|uniref:hypothetical protein n=1 Tax=Rhizobium sp. (strain CF080) TaxID=1144310 RepID=UPI000271ACE3|nr:hypothetical protein [Rhizobium sp. CF080]EUB97277.1 hypothetical protein PMI07_000853 [Rhizobium sp. CF080]
MAKFKAVWGPYREEIKGYGFKWFFSCVLMDGDVRGYTLTFFLDTRKFRVKHHTGGNESKYAKRLAEQGSLDMLPETQRGVIEGARVTDILRDRLGDERIARATIAALNYGRK